MDIKEKNFTLKNARHRRYPAESITDEEYADDRALLANTPTLVEHLLHSLEQSAGRIGLHVNTNKTEYMCFNQEGAEFNLKGGLLKLVEKFTYFCCCVWSSESYVNKCQAKALTAIDRLSSTYRSDLSDEIKRDLFRVAIASVLLYESTTWMLTNCIEKS